MKLALHWQILIGMVLGIVFGSVVSSWEGGTKFIQDWVSPIGTIFIKLLKLIAVPLILASLIKGIADLQDIAKFKSMGLRTIALYISTTVVAICVGLLVVNVLKPGEGISEETIAQLTQKYKDSESINSKIAEATNQTKSGPLQPLVDMFPDNIVNAMGNNGLMLQVITFSVLFGICLLLIKTKDAKPLTNFFNSLNEVILKMVDVIMLSAPYAVFALLANVVASSDSPEILTRLVYYALCVLLGLFVMLVFYLILVWVFAKKNPFTFIAKISPAQLTALSTSSSAATLPVTMERVTEHLGVDKEVASFVLPVGATINMDGTSLYQAVAAVFVAQALSFDLDFGMQITIVLTALLASIGSAAVPGAGMVMLIIVLQSIGFPEEKYPIALALIFAVDRPLDMCRTMINVTGDATVSTLVAKSLGLLGKPKVKNWDDNYPIQPNS